MKVIFLDVDGVLNCGSSQARCEGFIGIDNDKVKRLRTIVERTDAKIVLTSTWKSFWFPIDKEDQDGLANYLDRKLKREGLRILDKTKGEGMDRGKSILEWVNSRNVESFVILDDETFDYRKQGLLPYLVKSTFYGDNGGLQDNHIEMAVKILKQESEGDSR